MSIYVIHVTLFIFRRYNPKHVELLSHFIFDFFYLKVTICRQDCIIIKSAYNATDESQRFHYVLKMCLFPVPRRTLSFHHQPIYNPIILRKNHFLLSIYLLPINRL